MGGVITKSAGPFEEHFLAELTRSGGVLNLENRNLNQELINKITSLPQVTKQVVSLSLANNRLTSLCLCKADDHRRERDKHERKEQNNTRNNNNNNNQANNANTNDEQEGLDQESINPQWPMLLHLDLSGNTELFNYSTLYALRQLKSLRLANNELFKIPVEVWSLQRLTKLDLSNNRLQVIPAAIANLTHLNSLKLAQNALDRIPEELSKCKKLAHLDLSHNKYRELPVNTRVDKQRLNSYISSVASSNTSASNTLKFSNPFPSDQAQSSTQSSNQVSLPPPPIKYFDPARISYLGVTLLNLSNNQLTSLSPSIGLLRSLNSLNLGYNKLCSLPTELVLLTELKILDLRFNQLPSVLAEICALPRLSKLCLQNNRITSLPYEIKKLTKLNYLFLSSNLLVDLPDNIQDMVNLRVLKLCNNRLLTVPDSLYNLPKLRLLDMSFNKLVFISPAVANCHALCDLRLWGNKIQDIPNPILYSDVGKIVAYLKATDKDRVHISHHLRVHPRSHSKLSLRCTTPLSMTARAHSATRATAAYDTVSPPRRAHHSLQDTSDEEEEVGEDDEFTSVFRPIGNVSRTGSFTNLDAHPHLTAKKSSSGVRHLQKSSHPYVTHSSGTASSPNNAHLYAHGAHETTVVTSLSPQSTPPLHPTSARRNVQQSPNSHLLRMKDSREDDDEIASSSRRSRSHASHPSSAHASNSRTNPSVASSWYVDQDVLTDVVRRDRSSNSSTAPRSSSIAIEIVAPNVVLEEINDEEAQQRIWEESTQLANQSQQAKAKKNQLKTNF